MLGPNGSFSSLAVERLGDEFHPIFCDSFGEVFMRVKQGDLGFLPIRNKLVGKIAPVHAGFTKISVKFLRKFTMRVHFVFAAHKATKRRDITRIYTSLVARQQCEKFLKKSFPHVRIFSSSHSTSAAFKKVVQLSEKLPSKSAAIGSQKAASLYGLKVLCRDIQDSQDDWTEFALFKAKFKAK